MIACTAETCSADGFCSYDFKLCQCANDADCDDAIPCTVDTCGDDRTCAHDTAGCGCAQDADCDDQKPETIDSCDATQTCTARQVHYSTDMQAIFSTKCVPCHQGDAGCDGNDRCFVTDYSHLTAMADAAECTGQTVAQCVKTRIESGSMPAGGNCDTDPAGTQCLSSEELELLGAWAAGGHSSAP